MSAILANIRYVEKLSRILLPKILLITVVKESFQKEILPPTSARNPIVTISDGTLKGFSMRTVHNREIDAFNGIPYAKPPVGELRFRDPVKNEPWNGTREAIAQSPQCIQMDLIKFKAIHGSEDCLYLNVYRPTELFKSCKRRQRKLPVMVWIHGGGYFFGSGGIYGPAYLLDRDVILVTFNYRLGAFGFFSTGDDASSGNQALKDMVLALKWVQENIEAFGGDPDSVTIFGQSAGALAVHLLMTSPLSRNAGLFHRGISESGASFCYWNIVENATETARRVGEVLNCGGTSEEMISCLRSVPAGDLAKIQEHFFEWTGLFPLVIFAPVLEHEHPGAFMTEYPEETYKKREVPDIPWIAGVNKDELVWVVSGLILNQTAVHEVNNEFDWVGPIMLGFNGTDEFRLETSKKVWDFYMKGEDFSFATRFQFAEMLSDRNFVECSLEAQRYHSMYTEGPVYSYQFSFEGKYSVTQQYLQPPELWGVAHLDELIYLLNNTDYYAELKPVIDEEELKMSEIFTKIWANFATFGIPYLPEDLDLYRDGWQPIEKASNPWSPIKMLNLTLNPEMVDDPYVERYNFWRSLNLSLAD